MRVALLGFGLIGGSIARALHAGGRAPGGRVGGMDADGVAPAGAEDAVLTRPPPTPARAIDGADLVVLAAPPLDCLATSTSWADRWRVAPARRRGHGRREHQGAIVERRRTRACAFVGGHPMAGREATGFEAADATCSAAGRGSSCAGAGRGDADVDRVEALAVACGARPVRMRAAEHDLAVARSATCRSCSSAALVEAVAGPRARGRTGRRAAALAAGGWRT